MDNVLNFDSLKTISNTIKKITHSGSKHVSHYQLKEVFDICKINRGYVEHAFSRIMIMIKENHSEVRYAAVLLCHQFFTNFESFRPLLIDNFDKYLKYTLGENFNQILPPPKSAAAQVIKMTISNLDSWHSKYNLDYPKLHSTYNNLKNEKFVDFIKKEIYDPVKRAKEEKAAADSMIINRSLLKKSCDEINEIQEDIDNSIASLQTCFNLLIDFPDQDDSTTSSSLGREDNLRLHGVIKPNDIELNFNCDLYEVKITDENAAIIDNAKEMFSVINKKYLPKVKAWSVLISKVGENEDLSKKASQLENLLENLITKFNRLKFVDSTVKGEEDDCVSTDSEMEEVECVIEVKEKILVPEEKSLLDESRELEKSKPSTSKSTESFSERKKELLKIAPKIPYSTDLYHWEDDKISTETILPSATDGHRFWSSSSLDSIEVPAESANLRVIEFSGKFEPVERPCRAPLPSGKLCPRHDRVKCPFHGLIVPRDETGKIINKEDLAKVKNQSLEITPEWQNPKLLAEIKAATGLDLKIGKKKRNSKHPGLTDIKKKKSAIDNLSKKIFKSSTLKKVNKTLDSLDYKRYRDKFGDQFNYVHGT